MQKSFGWASLAEAGGSSMLGIILRPGQSRQTLHWEWPGVEAKEEGRMKNAESGQRPGVQAALQAAFLNQSHSAA
jgi:hypothetical protein